MPKDDEPTTSGGSEKPQNPGQPPASGTGANPTGQSGDKSADKAAAGSAQSGRDAENSAQGETNASSQRASALLKADHQKVEKLFAEFDNADDQRKYEIIREACQDLILHTLVEEEIFYPACREAASDEEPLDEAQVEHDSAKLLILELLQGRRDDRFRQAKFKVLAEQIRHHVAEEEKPRTGIFAKAQAAGIDTPELGHRIQQRKQQVQSRASGALRPTRPPSLQLLAGVSRPMEEYGMPRNYGPERDERGRFMSDDDRDDRRRYGAERSGGGGRRYADDDDDRGYRGRERDGGRRGGWFGDPEGHSEAARRGWDNPDHGPSGWFGDSRGHSEASRRGWDNPDHGPSGWYGDSRGHSEASRRGWDNPDHGQSGWYGDPEGHSEASRRGWDERRSFSGRDRDYDRDRDRDDDRGRYRMRDEEGRFRSRDDDDDRRYRSRSRDDDDDRRSSRGRGRDDDDDDRRGGWFGDSRGHSEASRKGWENRGR